MDNIFSLLVESVNLQNGGIKLKNSDNLWIESYSYVVFF